MFSVAGNTAIYLLIRCDKWNFFGEEENKQDQKSLDAVEGKTHMT